MGSWFRICLGVPRMGQAGSRQVTYNQTTHDDSAILSCLTTICVCEDVHLLAGWHSRCLSWLDSMA